ncbi:MAG TPA: alpha/beta fold hydrolase, partial [Rubrobacteraceae bacterium]|nr:alpha/beta fold hydrolase [Rubrobacteraceae bacterium]
VNRQLVNDVIKFKRLDGVDEALRKMADKLFPGGKQADVPDISNVEVPMLVVWGREDKVVPVSHSENVPDHARVEVLDDTGHMPQMEAAGAVNRVIGEFLDSQDK